MRKVKINKNGTKNLFNKYDNLIPYTDPNKTI